MLRPVAYGASVLVWLSCAACGSKPSAGGSPGTTSGAGASSGSSSGGSMGTSSSGGGSSGASGSSGGGSSGASGSSSGGSSGASGSSSGGYSGASGSSSGTDSSASSSGGSRSGSSHGGGSSGSGPSPCLPAHTDNVAASIDPPGGLMAGQVPQFVMFGSDDNQYADGVDWLVDTLFANRKNPDGSPARITFFITAGYGTSQNGGVFVNAGGAQTEQDVVNSWKHAYQVGHQIGNHTWRGATGGDGFDLATWNTEVAKSNDFLKNQVGVPACELDSWRFPYLLFDDAGFQAFPSAGFRIDTSVE